MKKLLITGAGGFLGSNIVEKAKGKWKVFGWSNHSKVNLPDKDVSYFDIKNSAEVIKCLNELNPDAIIHCAAISSEAACKRSREDAKNINVTASKIIGDWCKSKNARLIFTSTDLVFDGNNAPYSEEDEFTPSLYYGQLKREAEIALINNSFTSIVRLPLLYGIGLGEKKGLLYHFIEKCKNEVAQGLFLDEYRNPVWVNDIVDFLLQLIALNHSGILHLGGKEELSRVDLGYMFCKYLNLSTKNLNEITRSEIGMEDRPKNTYMISEQAYNLGFNPSLIKDVLVQIN